MKQYSTFFHLMVIIPGSILLQNHAIIFWQANVGFLSGIGWSVLLEIVSFWCWFQPVDKTWGARFVRFLGILTVLLLLIGPLYTVGEDIITSASFTLSDHGTYKEDKERLENAIKRKVVQAQRLLTIIEEKEDGWNTFNKVERTVEALQEELKNLPKPENGTKLPWLAILIVLMQASFILIVQSVITIGILKISAFYHSTEEKDVSSYKDLVALKDEWKEK